MNYLCWGNAVVGVECEHLFEDLPEFVVDGDAAEVFIVQVVVQIGDHLQLSLNDFVENPL